MRALGGGPKREVLALRVVVREIGAGLERGAGVAVVAQAVLEDAVRGGERRVDIARDELGFVEDVVAPGLFDQRARRFERGFRVEHGFELLVLDVHFLGGAFGGVGIGRHDRGDGLADKTDAVETQRVEVFDLLRLRPRTEAVHLDRVRLRPHLTARHDGDHARYRLGGFGVDRDDAGRREGAAHDRGVEHTVELQVGHIGARPGDQLAIVDRRDPAAEVSHVRSPKGARA